jgi:hypothetical protein
MASKTPPGVFAAVLSVFGFSGQNFEFDFLLVAISTPLLGMDFLAKFELSIIPSKQQVLHSASGRTFTKASTTPFISPWSPETAAAALPPQVQQLLEEFPSLLLHRRRRISCLGKSRFYSALKLALGVSAAPSSQEGWGVAPLWRLLPPERRHNTRQAPPPQHAAPQ